MGIEESTSRTQDSQVLRLEILEELRKHLIGKDLEGSYGLPGVGAVEQVLVAEWLHPKRMGRDS